ncbi:MAG: MEDS domain-containing protein [Candidatus Paceibacterota bacterium]|jgi:PAS domain S-box-containing protein
MKLDFFKKILTPKAPVSRTKHAKKQGKKSLKTISQEESILRGYPIKKVGVHDHLCLIYKNKEEQFATVIPFIRIGLERGEKCIYVADENTTTDVIEAMNKEGVDTETAIKKGSLKIINKKDTYLRLGYFDPDEMIEFLTESIKQAKEEGYSALRVTGEMTWVLSGEPGTEKLLEYEAKLNRFLQKNDCSALCQYNYKRFDPSVLIGVISTHPIVFVENTLCNNFYYIPTEEFLKNEMGGKEELDRLLHNLIDRERAEIKNKRSSEIIKESEKRLREAQKVSNIGSWELNILKNKLIWSEQIYTIFEIDPKKFSASYEAFMETVHPEDREMVDKAYKDSVENHKPYSIEHRLLMKDGRVKYVHEQCESFYDESGKAIRSVGVVQEITERKLKESAEERFKIVFDNANDGMVLADAVTKKFYLCNKAFSDMIGCTTEEIKKMDVNDLHPKKDLPYVLEMFEKQLRGEIKVIENIPVKRRDDSIFYADINSSPVTIGDKKFVLGIFRDITDRKKIQEELKKSEALLQLEIDRMPIGHIIWTKDFRVESWNPAAENIFGFTAEEVVNKHPYEIIVPKEAQAEVDKVWATLTTSVENVHIVNENTTKDGRIIICDWTNTRLISPDGKFLGVMSTVRDITKEKEIEKIRIDFLSLASHQLRTPLSGTKWLIETLRAHVLGPLSSKQDAYLEKIYIINERMIRLTHDMLSALKIESEESFVEKEAVSISKLFDELMLTVDSMAKSRNITIHNKTKEHKTPVINSNFALLSTALETILSNAINYSQNGKEVIFDVVKKGDEIIFSVQDFGIGIPPEEQSHISERFYRGSNAKVMRPDGTGLGLYISAEIAKKLGGSMTFTSKMGEGSTFMIHIPI